ncbi:MAG: aminotransferase class I/II-fold pyridoxal phosphate-dependent enzyme [Lysobacteraceae bacterium]
MPPSIATRQRLSEVRYEIRGELARRARELEAQGRELVKLNIGNPGAFGFRAPEHLQQAITENIERSDPYGHQQGLPEAREAIAAQQQARGARHVSADRVFIGNGVSELIDLSLRALLNPGDEVLLPSPDYPLWTAATLLNDGVAEHYPCEAANGFLPDPAQIESQITQRTRALVLINPNNPTGAVYPRELLEQLVAVAARHRLLLMVDEIYDSIVYDDGVNDSVRFQPLAQLAGDLPCLTFGGLSKVHRACGYRVGWVSLSGDVARTREYHHALDLLGALRLCANVPGQWAVPAALNGEDTITPLCQPGGRLHAARQAVIDACAASRWLSLSKPDGALYAFPGIDTKALPGFDDHRFALDVLENADVLIVPGNSFNVPYRNHFRVTLLPEPAQIADVFDRIERRLDVLADLSASKRHVA